MRMARKKPLSIEFRTVCWLSFSRAATSAAVHELVRLFGHDATLAESISRSMQCYWFGVAYGPSDFLQSGHISTWTA